MSKKQLQVAGLVNELEGASSFFVPTSPTPLPVVSQPNTQPNHPTSVKVEPNPTPAAGLQPKKKQAVTKPTSKLASTPASMLASTITSSTAHDDQEIVEVIRKTVKQVGKEPLFIRMTPEEKREISAIVYAFNEMYRDEGRKTSDNEAGRIAVNWMLEDYRQNGQNSILARVLAALNA